MRESRERETLEREGERYAGERKKCGGGEKGKKGRNRNKKDKA